jgi:molybdate transport system substrate-binding protein
LILISGIKLNYLVFFLIATVYLSVGCQSDNKQKLIIATAANAQYAIKEIAENFKSETGNDYALIISSSGKHTAQIEAGAPYDIFISADLKFPQALFDKGLTTDAPKIYGYGRLVLWSLYDEIDVDIEGLSVESLEHIAMPNPKTAPYGRAAKEFLDGYNIYDSISSKLVFGSSVAQTSQFILSKSAEIGFTAASVVMSEAMKDKGHWQEIGKDSYTPIAQGTVLIKSSTLPELSQQFYDYLFSEKAGTVLVKHGYSLNNSSL